MDRDTVDIIDKNSCYGCTNCAVMCNLNAISIETNDDGFLIPKVDYDKCNNCGLCVDVCPVKNDNLTEDITKHDVYALWSKTENLRLLSTSGGVASSISLKLLAENYATIGAVYSENYTKIYHEYCDTAHKIFNTIGSKYVQSNLSIGFKKAISHRNNKYVIFGAPCQIVGARNVLRKRRLNENNYYLVDFFCHGVPSYLIWEAFIKNLNKKIGAIHSLNLRFKDKSWHEYKIRALGQNGIYLKEFSKDTFGRLFLSNYCLRPSCYTCKFNKYSAADLRIGDFWGEYFEEDKLGTSIAIPVTDRGFDLIVKVDDLEVYSVPTSYLYESQSVKDGKGFEKPRLNLQILENLKNGNYSLDELYRKYIYYGEISIYIKTFPKKFVKSFIPVKYRKKLKLLMR